MRVPILCLLAVSFGIASGEGQVQFDMFVYIVADAKGPAGVLVDIGFSAIIELQ